MYFVRLELTTGTIEFIIDDISELENKIIECGDTYMGCQIKRIETENKEKSR